MTMDPPFLRHCLLCRNPGRRRRVLALLLALSALFAVSAAARAAEPVKIGIGYGLAFLPAYICEDLKLVEKHGKAQHLDLRAVYERFSGAGAIADAIRSRAIDMGPFGVAPLLEAWAKGKAVKGARRQIFAVSGMTTLPLVLLSDRRTVRTLADLRPTDRIAVPTLTSPQTFFLQMQAEKAFGQYDRLRGEVVEMSHAKALAALIAGDNSVTAYFSSPPYTQIALKDGKIHQILSSEQVIGGKASLLVLGATKAYIERHRQIAQIVEQAMDDAAHLIRDDPRRAARIFLTHEPSKALKAADVEAVLRQNKDEFGSAVAGIGAFAEFMARHGTLKTPPQSWKDVVAPALLHSPST
jgi:NitT/TauT family transport system substrate-binding protein